MIWFCSKKIFFGFMKKLVFIFLILISGSTQASEYDQIRQMEALKKQEKGDTVFAEIIEKLSQSPKDFSLHYKMAQAYRQRGLLELAQVSCERVLKLKPTHAWAHVGLSLIFRQKKEDAWELYHLQQAAIKAPMDDKIRFKLGRLYMEPKAFDYKKAKKEYKALQKMQSPLASKLGRVMELE